MAKWDAVFLKDAQERLAKQMDGYDLSLADVKDFVSCRIASPLALALSYCLTYDRAELTPRWKCARMKYVEFSTIEAPTDARPSPWDTRPSATCSP